jgi:hypothetical protein
MADESPQIPTDKPDIVADESPQIPTDKPDIMADVSPQQVKYLQINQISWLMCHHNKSNTYR